MVGYCRHFRRDRNRYGGGIFIYVQEDIPCKILPDHNLPEDIEGIFLELNFRKSKLISRMSIISSLLAAPLKRLPLNMINMF